MAAKIEEVPVEKGAPEAETSEAPEADASEAPEAAVPNTPMPKAKGRPKGSKDQTIRKRRPPPPPPSESDDETSPLIPQEPYIPDMRSRKQRMFDSWFD